MLVADRAGNDKTSSVLLLGGPPEPVLQDLFAALNTWVTGEQWAHCSQTSSHEEQTGGNRNRNWDLQRGLYPLLHR